MRTFSNSFGYDGDSDTSSSPESTEQISTRKQRNQELIKKANSVSIKKIFKLYSVYADEHNTVVLCPLKKHKKPTISFEYYPQTNTFYCHNCRSGTYPTNFVAIMDNISVIEAASKIIDLFESETNLDNISSDIDFSERLEILVDFSNFIRNFILDNKDNLQAFKYAEEKTIVFDRLYKKFDDKKIPLNNNALKSIIETIKNTFKLYNHGFNYNSR